jgi:hypothetical protein
MKLVAQRIDLWTIYIEYIWKYVFIIDTHQISVKLKFYDSNFYYLNTIQTIAEV